MLSAAIKGADEERTSKQKTARTRRTTQAPAQPEGDGAQGPARRVGAGSQFSAIVLACRSGTLEYTQDKLERTSQINRFIPLGRRITMHMIHGGGVIWFQAGSISGDVCARCVLKVIRFVMLLAASFCFAQDPGDFKPATSNVLDVQYPKVDSNSRVQIRFKAPEATKVKSEEHRVG